MVNLVIVFNLYYIKISENKTASKQTFYIYSCKLILCLMFTETIINSQLPLTNIHRNKNDYSLVYKNTKIKHT